MESSHGEASMQFGMIGLGRMGANMVRRLQRGGHTCVVYDRAARSRRRAREGRCHGGILARGFREEAREAACHLPHGPRGLRRRVDRRARAASRQGRHDHRRRQLALPRRHRAREAPEANGPPLRRHGHVRRRLGPRARLLPDDRRRRRGREAARPDLLDAGAGTRLDPHALRGARSSAAPPSTATCTAARRARAIS